MVLPGIMGSELVVSATGEPIWGTSDLQWYVRAWTTGRSLDALKVDDDERGGKAGRVTATRLLKFPAFAPVLRGIEPYRGLIGRLREIVPVPEAVRSFPYDWRLPVAHNAAVLAGAADDHLRWWRSHRLSSRSARLVLVGHSMGGLIARYFVGLLGGDTETRTVVTLGTPFRGSVKAATMLNSGRGAAVPMPARRLRQLVSDMPSMHDLLPTYRCVSEGEGARHLTTGDVETIGGDRSLAEAAFNMHRRLAAVQLYDLRAVIGINQPTAQSMTLRDGVAVPRRCSYFAESDDGPARLVDRGGDGTVPREAATAGSNPLYLSQTHGALARMPEVIDHVRGVLTEMPDGAWLGRPPAIEVELPDVVAVGSPFRILVGGEQDPAAATCRISDAATDRAIAHPPLFVEEHGLSADVAIHRPGIYRAARARPRRSSEAEVEVADIARRYGAEGDAPIGRDAPPRLGGSLVWAIRRLA